MSSYRNSTESVMIKMSCVTIGILCNTLSWALSLAD